VGESRGWIRVAQARNKNRGSHPQRSDIRPPIIVYGDGTTDIFEFTEDAESYLEPIDVEQIKHAAYDCEGRLLRLLPTSPRVTIESAELDPSHQDEVRALLANFLASLGVSEQELSNLSLEDLGASSLKYKTE
jgi:hypothetical protein